MLPMIKGAQSERIARKKNKAGEIEVYTRRGEYEEDFGGVERVNVDLTGFQ